MTKLVILDRDGVINEDRDDFVKSVDEWVALPGSMDAIAFLNQADFRVVVATNQSGIGRGFFTIHDLNEMHAKMHRLVQQAGGQIEAVWFCPHTAADKCACRKPLPGMVEDILQRYLNTDPDELYLVGDSLRDLQAIEAVGGQPVLVLTGKGKKTVADPATPEDTMVFHDMPIHPGYEISQDVMEAHLETILDEAENRRHAEKGLLVYLITGKLDW